MLCREFQVLGTLSALGIPVWKRAASRGLDYTPCILLRSDFSSPFHPHSML